MCLEEISEEEQRRIWHRDGYTEGLNKGEQKGRSEKAVEDAKRMLIKKYPMNDISEITGLTLEKVQELKEKINRTTA